MAFDKNMKISEFKTRMAELNKIPNDNIRVHKVIPWKLTDVMNMPTLDWTEPMLTKSATLSTLPWRCKPGDIIVFKDYTLPEKIQEPEKDQAKVVSNRAEAGIKIYTPAEQKQRAEDKKKREAEQKKQQEEARSDLQKHLAAAGKDAKAALPAADSQPAAAQPTTPPAPAGSTKVNNAPPKQA